MLLHKPIRVLCVDDNDLVVEAIQIKLSHSRQEFEWLGQLSTADHLVTTAMHERPDVVLLDIDMPGRDPFAALAQLSELFPQVRVIMLTGYVRRDLIDRAVEAGAWGYISKHDGADILIDAIHNVMRGEFVMGPHAEEEYRRH
jgi:two-component system response regulator DesR